MSVEPHIESKELSPLCPGQAMLFFIAAGVLLYVATHIGIPFMAERTSLEPIVLWFLLGGLGVFVPITITAITTLLIEGVPFRIPDLKQRLRFAPMNKGDWLWTLGGIVAIGIASAAVVGILHAVSGEVSLHPSFMKMEPLSEGRYWILAAWLLFWLFNILGEEVLWRGVLLPRQEAHTGKWAWLPHAIGWGVFHIAFGWTLLLTLLPIILILPYIVQKRRNSWIGVIIHAGLNGPGFIAVAFGAT